MELLCGVAAARQWRAGEELERELALRCSEEGSAPRVVARELTGASVKLQSQVRPDLIEDGHPRLPLLGGHIATASLLNPLPDEVPFCPFLNRSQVTAANSILNANNTAMASSKEAARVYCASSLPLFWTPFTEAGKAPASHFAIIPKVTIKARCHLLEPCPLACGSSAAPPRPAPTPTAHPRTLTVVVQVPRLLGNIFGHTRGEAW